MIVPTPVWWVSFLCVCGKCVTGQLFALFVFIKAVAHVRNVCVCVCGGPVVRRHGAHVARVRDS